MTTTLLPETVLAQYKRTTEIITAARHSERNGTYHYTVTITGGKHHGVQINCHTEHSALWLFNLVVDTRRRDCDWAWLATCHELSNLGRS